MTKGNRDRMLKSNILRVITVVLRVNWPIVFSFDTNYG